MMFYRVARLLNKLSKELILFAYKISGRDGITIKMKSDAQLYVRINDKLARDLFMNASFEKATVDSILSRLEEGMTVLDIGANIGYYTVIMSKAVGETGRVIAIEPNPLMVDELKRNLDLNRINNVAIKQIALSDKNGLSEFYNPEFGAESHGSLKPNKTFHVNNTITVKTAKIDDMLDQLGCKKIDFIKMDAEGAELSIFRGGERMLSQMKPEIIFECAENLCEAFGHNVFDCLSYLHAQGYDVREIDYGMWLGQPAGKGERNAG